MVIEQVCVKMESFMSTFLMIIYKDFRATDYDFSWVIKTRSLMVAVNRLAEFAILSLNWFIEKTKSVWCRAFTNKKRKWFTLLRQTQRNWVRKLSFIRNSGVKQEKSSKCASGHLSFKNIQVVYMRPCFTFSGAALIELRLALLDYASAMQFAPTELPNGSLLTS